jgi:transposase
VRRFGVPQGARWNYKILGEEPSDHAIGRSRGGLTSKIHLVADGRGRPLSMLLTPGNVNDTTMMTATIGRIRVPRPGRGRPRTRPERVLADKGYPSKANRSYLADRGIKATIPDKADQRQNRTNKGSGGGRPPDFDAEIYKNRNVVERSFNRLKNWRGIAMRSDKTARNYQAGVTLAAALIWINTDLINTP